MNIHIKILNRILAKQIQQHIRKTIDQVKCGFIPGSEGWYNICKSIRWHDTKHRKSRKLLELINEFSKVAGYKINTQESVRFLYTNNEKSEREILETIPLTTASERIKYLGINLPKGEKDLY